MQTPAIVSPQEWEAARQHLLVKEKELARARDALAAGRRRMPWLASADSATAGPRGVQSARRRAAEATRGWCSRHWPGSRGAADTGRHGRHDPAEGFRDMRRARTDKEQIWQSQERQSW
jgi:hypothetical protein